MIDNPKIVESYRNQNIRGFRMAISMEIFNELINRAMGLDIETIFVKSVQTHGWNEAVEICAVTADERFPKLEEGVQYPQIIPIMRRDVITREDGRQEYSTTFEGFQEV